MSRRSNSANTANTWAMAAPWGVVVSTATSRATSPHPDLSARSISPVASCTLRVSRSSLDTMSTLPRPTSRSDSAAVSAGRSKERGRLLSTRLAQKRVPEVGRALAQGDTEGDDGTFQAVGVRRRGFQLSRSDAIEKRVDRSRELLDLTPRQRSRHPTILTSGGGSVRDGVANTRRSARVPEVATKSRSGCPPSGRYPCSVQVPHVFVSNPLSVDEMVTTACPVGLVFASMAVRVPVNPPCLSQ